MSKKKKLPTPREVWAVIAPDGHIKHLDQDEQWMRDHMEGDDTVIPYFSRRSAWGSFLAARAVLIHEATAQGRSAEDIARWLSCDPGQVRLIVATELATIPGTESIEQAADPAPLADRQGGR